MSGRGFHRANAQSGAMFVRSSSKQQGSREHLRRRAQSETRAWVRMTTLNRSPATLRLNTASPDSPVSVSKSPILLKRGSRRSPPPPGALPLVPTPNTSCDPALETCEAANNSPGKIGRGRPAAAAPGLATKPLATTITNLSPVSFGNNNGQHFPLPPEEQTQRRAPAPRPPPPEKKPSPEMNRRPSRVERAAAACSSDLKLFTSCGSPNLNIERVPSSSGNSTDAAGADDAVADDEESEHASPGPLRPRNATMATPRASTEEEEEEATAAPQAAAAASSSVAREMTAREMMDSVNDLAPAAFGHQPSGRMELGRRCVKRQYADTP